MFDGGGEVRWGSLSQDPAVVRLIQGNCGV